MTCKDVYRLRKYCKAINTQPYKEITICHDKNFGYGIRIFDGHSGEITERYSCNHRIFKVLREELRTDYDLLTLQINGRFSYYK